MISYCLTELSYLPGAFLNPAFTPEGNIWYLTLVSLSVDAALQADTSGVNLWK